MTKPTKWLCAQQRLRSVWACAQSDQCLCCVMGSQGPKLSSCGQRRLWSDWADAQADLSLRWAHTILLVLPCRGSYTYKYPSDNYKEEHNHSYNNNHNDNGLLLINSILQFNLLSCWLWPWSCCLYVFSSQKGHNGPIRRRVGFSVNHYNNITLCHLEARVTIFDTLMGYMHVLT